MRSTQALLREIRRARAARAAPAGPAPAAGPRDLLAWTARHLPSVLTCPPSPFHRELCRTLDALPRGSRLSVQAPRGAAKSTYVSYAYPLREALEGREPFAVICSDTAGQAKDFLRQIRREVESNESLRAAYPRSCRPGPLWRDDRVSLANGCELAALGTGGKIRGRKSAANRRPTLVVIDDPQNKDHIQSELRRRRSMEWLTKDVMSAGEPGTSFVVVGTALHRESIVCELERAAGWRTERWKALMSWPERLDLWAEWQLHLFDYDLPDEQRQAGAMAFYQANKQEMDRGAVCGWPERFGLYDLMMRRASDGHAAFESEFQNNPHDPAACEWPAECFDRPDLYFDEWPPDLVVRTIGWDPSKGRTDKPSDYSALVKFGRDRHGREYVEADLARRPADVQCADVVRHAREFNPHGVAVETTAMQELLLPLLRAAAAREEVEVPTYCFDHAGENKEVRIRMLTQPVVQRRFRFKGRSPGTQLLLQQLRDFPGAEKRDGPDALEMARRLAIDLTSGKAIRRR